MDPSNQTDERLDGPNLAQILKAAFSEALSDLSVIASLHIFFHGKSNKTTEPEKNR